MQLTGAATVTNESNIVDAAIGVDWSQATTGSWFTREGSFAVYDLAAPPAFVGGRWRVYLTANYSGSTEAAAPSVVHKDFGPNGEIIFGVGDTEILPLLNRWCRGIAQLIGGGGIIGGGGGPDTADVLTESGEQLDTESGEHIHQES